MTMPAAAEDDPMHLFSEGKAAFKAENYAAADKLFEDGLVKCEALVKSLQMWRRKCATHLEEAAQQQQQQPAPQPAATIPAPAATEEQLSPQELEEAKKPAEEAPKPAGVRMDWFQTPTNVTVTFYIKIGQQIAGSKDHGTVTIDDTSVHTAIRLKDGSEYTHTVSPFYGQINKDQSTYTVKPMKVEIVLVKHSAGEHWEMLEGRATAEVFPDKAAAYPTSSKKGKDWTRYEIDADEDKPEGNEALNKLFQDIYGKADDDTKRAMMKSFQESNGTVLSTNWSEVGAKKVEGAPPKGMEEKKWGA